LRLPPHPELATLRDILSAADEARYPIDRYWRVTFLLTFLAIHIGRMDAEWNLVGLFSPGVAVVGDVLFALVLAWGVITPVRLGWRVLTRPVERRAWTRLLLQVDQGQSPGWLDRVVRYWLNARTRFAWRLGQARRSPTVAVRRGLQIGLPVTAVSIALNPIWGFSWYFNTENWATEVWSRWAEQRTDTWREQMVHAVREQYRGRGMPGGQLLQVVPEGVAAGADFSFLVIGDPVAAGGRRPQAVAVSCPPGRSVARSRRPKSDGPRTRRWWPRSGGKGREITRGKAWAAGTLSNFPSIGHGSVASAHEKRARHRRGEREDGNEEA
jgi:hypothetical protein